MPNPSQAPTPPDDAALVRRMSDGDEDALSELYDRHSGLVLAICMRLLGDRGRAEETVLDVFSEMWRRAGAFDPQRGGVRSYLLLLARSRSIDRLRSRGSEPAVRSLETANAVASDNELPNERVLRLEQAGRIRKAMDELDPVQREAIEAAFFDGLSHSQVARKLDRPLGTIKTHIRQALRLLRDELATDAPLSATNPPAQPPSNSIQDPTP